MTDVVISRDSDGTILVTATPDPGGPEFTRAVLDVGGATLSWPDVTDIGLPNAEIHDVSQAHHWLWALYGEGVAKAVHEDGPVSTEDTELAGPAGRLAFGHWAARWWPASYLDGIPALATDLLGLELAALTYRCQQLFDDSPDDLTAELIEEHQAALDPLIQWWRADGPVEHVLRLVDAAADSVGLDSEPLGRLRSFLDDPATGAPVDPAELFAPRSEFALAAGDPGGATGRIIARGTGTNDWRRYPPGFVDASEEAVTWVARAIGARRRVEITVAAGTLSPVVELAADVQANRVRLTKQDDLWTGNADLAGQDIEVAVLLPGFDPGVGHDVRAEREAIRALARRRLALGSAEPFLAEIVAASGD
jgi:hypothetical protein